MHKPTFLFLIALLYIFNSCSNSSDNPEEPDVIAPTVSISIAGFPNNTTSGPIVVSNRIEINVDAKDAGGIAKIEAFIDEQKVGEDTTAPYQIIIDVSSFDSKVVSTDKFKDFILKVSATDMAGNVTSTQQTINIDNEMPSIMGVSLQEGTTINGDTNPVVFEVMDNEVLSSVKTFLNGELLSEVTDGNFVANINTLNLDDGDNIFKIEAMDSADNLSVFEVNFISDNTGPEISLENLEDGQILDELISLNPQVTDEFSEIASLEVKLRGEQIQFFEDLGNTNFEFNPETYPVGDSMFTFIAIDELGNETSFNINNSILRLLIKVSIPEGFLSSSWTSFWVFASEMDGTPIVTKSVALQDDLIRLHAPTEFDFDKKFMLTFLADDNSFSDSFNRITNIQGITRDNLSEINFNLPRRRSVLTTATIPVTGFVNEEYIAGHGIDYTFSHFNFEQSGNFETISLNDTNNSSSNYYLYSNNLENFPYAHYRLSEPLIDGQTIDLNDFITDADIASSSFNVSGVSSVVNNQLQILGFETSNDSQNDIFHEIYRGSPELIFGGVYEFHYNTNFDSYSHQLVLDTYLTNRKGLPASNYSIPNWSLDYQQSGNDITISKSGGDHSLGRIRLSPADGLGGDYIMTVLFDSQSADVITLPEIPEEMKDLSLYTVAQNQGFDFEQVHLTSFDNITSYEQYLDLIIKNNRDHNSFSNTVISKMKSTSDSGTPFNSFHFN
ncbi:Ig-like domain-containing protein [Costertonia aggregata]|uniref:Ig-like domain-containing protein n=1 Tax=Costertonia aggregata TaxID=343403 RepID=A0A7H9AL05_9FLAO|nr:Ig-like domain-containing protein [Costertonia aggregata]QLG44140.1 Ig-like domain-containing protein [Costertonia aggregata]